MTLSEKFLQIRTANFATSEINSQFPPVSLKAELTAYPFCTWPTLTITIRLHGLAGPGEIVNWLGYLNGYTARSLIAQTYLKVLVLKSTTIDHQLVSDRCSFQYFQKLASRAQDVAKIDEAMRDLYKKQPTKFIVETEEEKNEKIHCWNKEPCSTIKYLIISVMYVFRIFVCCLWICNDRIMRRLKRNQELQSYFNSDHSAADTEDNPVRKLYEDYVYLNGQIDWSLLGVESVINISELSMLFTQAYYTKQGQLKNWTVGQMPRSSFLKFRIRYAYFF